MALTKTCSSKELHGHEELFWSPTDGCFFFIKVVIYFYLFIFNLLYRIKYDHNYIRYPCSLFNSRH